MHYFTLLCLISMHFAMFSQTNEQQLLDEHHSFFKSVSNNLDLMATNENRIAYLDSLKSIVKTDYLINRLNILRANTYRNFDLNKTYEILQQVEAYLKEYSDYHHLKTHYNITKGRALYDSGKHNESLGYYTKAESVSQKFNDPDELWRYPIESKTGIISNYVALNRNDEAISLLTELEKTVSPNDKLDEYVYVLNMLGYLHTKSKNYKEGIRYFAEITNRLKNKDDYKESYFGAVNNLAYIYQLNKRRPEAINILEEALVQTKKYQIINRELLLSNNLGFLYLEEDNLDRAEELGLNSIEKSTNTFEEIKADAERLLSVVYYRKGESQKALEYAESSANYFRQINDLKRLKYALSIKNKVLIKTEDFEEATKVNAEMISLMDSITIKNDMQNLQKTLVEFETEKKDSEITILKQKEEIASVKLAQQRDQILFLVGLLIVVLVLGSVVFIYHKKLGRIQNLVLRSKLTRSQFNPHYINNAFTALQAELVEHSFNEKLINYTSSISRFSRLVLESTFKDEWSLNDEKNMIENYLSIQQHRLENSFQYYIDSNIDQNELLHSKIPSAITQTVLENAIEHGGYSNSNKHGKIEILFSSKNNQLLISIKNNILDEVLENSVEKRPDSPSRGLQITKQRIELHSKLYNRAANFNFIKKENEAEVVFQLPVLAA
ncbi:histidine kinase [Winogradskyella sp. A3E31]|uniref:histidine kinase n=1 Tax=Winogradskyella sp. A3E31 TaxID=3349637 RepID=UPI00398A886A